MTQKEEDALTADDIEEVKDLMVDLAARLERMATKLQGPARLSLPQEPERKGHHSE